MLSVAVWLDSLNDSLGENDTVVIVSHADFLRGLFNEMLAGGSDRVWFGGMDNSSVHCLQANRENGLLVHFLNSVTHLDSITGAGGRLQAFAHLPPPLGLNLGGPGWTPGPVGPPARDHLKAPVSASVPSSGSKL